MAMGSKRAATALVGLVLAVPAGSNSTGERVAPPKSDYATIGSTAQVMTPRELQKMAAARAAPAALPLDGKNSSALPLPEKPTSFGTAGSLAAPGDAPLQEKATRPSAPGSVFLGTTRVAPKPPEKSTCEPGSPDLSAAETAKLAAQRRRPASAKDAGRSAR